MFLLSSKYLLRNGNVSITATKQTFALGSRGEPYAAVALFPMSLETVWFMKQLYWRTQIKWRFLFLRKTLSEIVQCTKAHSSVSRMLQMIHVCWGLRFILNLKNVIRGLIILAFILLPKVLNYHATVRFKYSYQSDSKTLKYAMF